MMEEDKILIRATALEIIWHCIGKLEKYSTLYYLLFIYLGVRTNK